MSRPRSDLAALPPAARELAALVPGVYLARDADRPDRPLARLLEVLAAQLAELDDAVRRLQEDHVVELASPAVLPLIAELVGAHLLGSDARSNRAVVASTVRWRRHAGTLPTLEDVLTQTTGWSTEVDEAYRSVLATQDLDDLLLHRGRTADVVDPVHLADPLSRPAGPAPRLAADEPALVEELARLGAADALRAAVSPRTLDLDGWVRPERVVVRTTRLAVREVDDQELVHLRAVPLRGDPADRPSRFVGLALDPRGEHVVPRGPDVEPVPFPLAGARSEPAPLLGAPWTERREPDSAPRRAAPRVTELVTPTALAADPAGAERGDLLTLRVDGVVLAGPPLPLPPPGPLAYAPPGPSPLLRLADAARPSPGETWHLQLLAVDDHTALETGAADPAVEPPGEVGATNPWVARVTVGRDDPGTGEISDAGRVPAAGAQLALRLRRTTPTAYARAADGSWSRLDVVPRRGHPLSPTVAADVPGEVVLARLERVPGGGTELALLRPDDPGADWSLAPLDLPGLATDLLGDEGQDGVTFAAAGVADGLVLAGPARTTPGGRAALALWRVDGLAAGALLVRRLDDPQAAAPPLREEAAAVLDGGRLWLHGGRERPGGPAGPDGARGVRADLWSIPVAGNAPRPWTRHRARHAPARAGGRLVPLGGGLVLVGGAERPGRLSASVRWVDPSAARPDWLALPDLPVTDGPGALWARADGDALVVVTWADCARPASLRLDPGAARWSRQQADTGETPNPPAEGDAVPVGDRLLVPGPVPLPASEALVDTGTTGHLAFLPALDPPDGGVVVVLLDADGSTQVRPASGPATRPSLRLGTSREEPGGGRRAPALRLSVPGRLGWRPFAVRQVDLTSWDRALALGLDDAVAVDPRLGRLLVARAAAAGGRFTASYRTGRAAALGAGFAPPGREVPEAWLEPPDPTDSERSAPATAPELDPELAGGAAAVTAWVVPPEAGDVRDGVPVVAGLGEAVLGEGTLVQPLDAPAFRAHVVAVDGSPRLEPATLTVAQGAVVSVFGSSTGSVPHLGADDGVSLTLLERLAAGEEPEAGPTWFLSGLSTDGAVELLVTAGLLDVRWCDLAPPRRDDALPAGGAAARLGLRVAGAAGGAPAGPVLPGAGVPAPAPPPLTVRLTGCVLGGVVVPPWVQVIAAGCTIDAGADGALALDAAGARVRLRACTVRGRLRAGVLEASSCLLRGGVDVDRPERGWLRYTVLDDAAAGGRTPVRYESPRAPVSLAEVAATSPYYLLPDENNAIAVLAAGEGGTLPGAHGDRSRSMVELAGRSAAAVPIGLVPHQMDGAAQALRRMNRRQA